MNKQKYPQYTPNPMFNGLPEYLKDPNNFDKIQKMLLETLATGCSHSEPSEWSACKKCTDNMIERRLLMQKLGFISIQQYMAWRKVMETILGRVKPKVKTNKYNKKVSKDGYEMLSEEEISKLEMPDE